MTGDDAELEARADALRRVVYGTPDGYETDAATELERVEAELARRAEERRAEASRAAAVAAAEAAGAAAAAAATVANSGDPGDTTPGAGDSPASRAAHPDARTATAAGAASSSDLRSAASARRWPAVLAIAGVLTAFAAAGGVALVGALTPPRGLAVFDRPQQPEDESLVVALGAQADTVRKIDELFGRGFWAYLNGGDQVCLSVVPTGGSNLVERGECASRERFAEHGISVQYAATELGARRPRGSGERDVVIVTWLPDADGVEWELVMIDPPADDRMTYGEWSTGRDD